MQRQLVESTSLRSIAYDPTAFTLEVEFSHGGVYQYFNVPEVVFQGLLSASSKGAFFQSHVRNAGFTYLQVESK